MISLIWRVHWRFSKQNNSNSKTCWDRKPLWKLSFLILITITPSSRNSIGPHRRKHDIDLYDMYHGNVFAANVAVFPSYDQDLKALAEANQFNGMIIIFGYLPQQSENKPAPDILKGTKLTIDHIAQDDHEIEIII